MASLERRHEELGALLGTAEVINKRAEFLKLSREHAELDPLVAAWKAYAKLMSDAAQAKQMADAEPDPELRELARDELRALEQAQLAAEHQIKILLLPRDPSDGKNAILEIRGGHRRRRGRAVRGRPVPDVHALRRAPELEGSRSCRCPRAPRAA